MSYDTDTRRYGVGDLAVVVALVVAFDAVVALSLDFPTLRLALGLPVLLLAPGWAVVAALYPRGGDGADPTRTRAASTPSRGASTDPISPVARFALAVAASVAVVAAVAVAVNASPWLIRPLPMLVGITAATVLAVVVAGYRRFTLPAMMRYSPSVPWRPVARAARPRLSATFFLGILLVASVVGATAVLATSDAVKAGTNDQFTEFSALTANGSGEYVTANFTDTVEAGGSLYFELANGEGARTDYTLVFVREAVAVENNETVVQSATERDRRSVTVGAGDTQRVEFEPRPSGENSTVRLRAYLYRGDAPEDPSPSSAYRSVRIWYDETPLETASSETAG
ncbi:DUF1616 domain-containing protein [Halosimplex aquaticum]|uniref:DUF1616 domain-containing protein n=1 Tax=Halosimplex aquaticum TaxID=3026162 RepID=A0ABD5XXV7_9EURY|nr:DUF1616 domain-containing protein [Halosimplex aquaticum]